MCSRWKWFGGVYLEAAKRPKCGAFVRGKLRESSESNGVLKGGPGTGRKRFGLFETVWKIDVYVARHEVSADERQFDSPGRT